MKTENIKITEGDIVKVISSCTFGGYRYIDINMLAVVKKICENGILSIRALDGDDTQEYKYSPNDVLVIYTPSYRTCRGSITVKKTIFEVGDIIKVEDLISHLTPYYGASNPVKIPAKSLLVVVKVEGNNISVVDLHKYIMYPDDYSTVEYSADDNRITFTGKKIMKG